MHISSSLVATLWWPIPTLPVEAGVGLVGIGESTSSLGIAQGLRIALRLPNPDTYTYERMDFMSAIALYCYSKYCLESLLLRLMKLTVPAK